MNDRSHPDNHPKKASGRLIHAFVHKKFRPWVSILLTIAVMGALLALVYFFNIPNPNMVLIAGLVICCAVFGFCGGITAGVIMLGYTLFFFSSNHDFITFDGQNLAKVFVSLFGIVVVVLFVCMLKRQEVREFRETNVLTEKLHYEIENLQQSSATDELTGIGNRQALRMRFDSYQNCDLCVIMMDIDDFKGINDNFGHDVGDTVLVKTGKMLGELFGASSCYRYGGDEFLVLLIDPFAQECMQKMESIVDRRPVVTVGDHRFFVNYSVGYRIAHIETAEDFRDALKIADTNMYEAKRSGKNRIVGTAGK